jgi:hypothetical protein
MAKDHPLRKWSNEPTRREKERLLRALHQKQEDSRGEWRTGSQRLPKESARQHLKPKV